MIATASLKNFIISIYEVDDEYHLRVFDRGELISLETFEVFDNAMNRFNILIESGIDRRKLKKLV